MASDGENIRDLLDVRINAHRLRGIFGIFRRGQAFFAAGPKYFDNHSSLLPQMNQWAVALEM